MHPPPASGWHLAPQMGTVKHSVCPRPRHTARERDTRVTSESTASTINDPSIFAPIPILSRGIAWHTCDE
eukprot:scaffold3497_cov153-Isochrysis_galbana.AAC.6